MEQLDTHNTSKHSFERQVELTELLLKLDHQQWKQLGLYQSFHQTLFKAALELNLTLLQRQQDVSPKIVIDLDPTNHSQTKDALHKTYINKSELLEIAEKSLKSKDDLLFNLTSTELIDELCRSDWLTSQDLGLSLNPRRWYQLHEQVKISKDGIIQIDSALSGQHESDNRIQKSGLEEESILARRAERLKKSLEYIDPLKHISKANETPFTIRRLDLILTNLDGLVIKQESFRELLNLSLVDFELIFDATDRLGLTRRTDDGYVRLDFHGISLARQDRPKRLKALSMIASRLRREAKFRENS